jgi:hypothetical protein
MTDDQSVSLSLCHTTIWEPPPICLIFSKIIFWHGFFWCRTPSLTRGRVCSLQLLLDLAGSVFLEFEFLGTHHHIFTVSKLNPLPPSKRPCYCSYLPQEMFSPDLPPESWFWCWSSSKYYIVIQFVPHRKHNVTSTNANQLMLFNQTANIYYKNHKNKLCSP